MVGNRSGRAVDCVAHRLASSATQPFHAPAGRLLVRTGLALQFALTAKDWRGRRERMCSDVLYSCRTIGRSAADAGLCVVDSPNRTQAKPVGV